MRLHSVKNRLKVVELKQPKRSPSRAELENRMRAYGLNPREVWKWIGAKKRSPEEIMAFAAQSVGIPLEGVRRAVVNRSHYFDPLRPLE